jgi:hypothetical protein
VRPEDVAESIPCGPDLDAIVESVHLLARRVEPASQGEGTAGSQRGRGKRHGISTAPLTMTRGRLQ